MDQTTPASTHSADMLGGPEGPVLPHALVVELDRPDQQLRLSVLGVEMPVENPDRMPMVHPQQFQDQAALYSITGAFTLVDLSDADTRLLVCDRDEHLATVVVQRRRWESDMGLDFTTGLIRRQAFQALLAEVLEQYPRTGW